MTLLKRMTKQERCDAFRFVDAAMGIIVAEVEQGMTPEEIALLVGTDTETIQKIRQFEIEGIALSDVQAMSDRLANLTAHDKMRLAAFRADSEQKPSATDPSTDQPEA